MIDVKIKKDSIWLPLYAPKKTTRYIVVYGPRLGGKSFQATRAAMVKMGSGEYMRGYLMRNVLDTVRDSVFQDCVDRISEMKLPFSVTESSLVIRHGKNEMKGRGFRKSSGSDTAKNKSLAGKSYALIEEAEEIDKDDFTQFDFSFRTNKGQNIIVLVFNPPALNSQGAWLYDEWFDLTPDPDNDGFFDIHPKDRDDTEYIFSNYKVTEKHLDPSVVQKAEQMKQKDLAYYLHKIVGKVPSGRTGLIFKSFEIISVEEYERLEYNKKYGMDFGSIDPTTHIETMLHDGTLYIREKLYKTGMTTDDVDNHLRDYDSYETVCDSAEKMTIETLENRGRYVTSAQKGSGSVMAGIRKLQSYKLVICEDSVNTIHETKNYVYRTDKHGIPMDEPEDKFNHAWDAIRYSVEDENPIEFDLKAEYAH